jgi:hypothetical protein
MQKINDKNRAWKRLKNIDNLNQCDDPYDNIHKWLRAHTAYRIPHLPNKKKEIERFFGSPSHAENVCFSLLIKK